MTKNVFNNRPDYHTTGSTGTKKTKTSSGTNTTSVTSADRMLDIINVCIENALKTSTTLSGAIITSVNSNGTVNVRIPPDDKIFTNIPNQSPFELKPGDCVELMLKNGSFNNCWVVAKHEATVTPKTFELTKEEKQQIVETVKSDLLQYIEEITTQSSGGGGEGGINAVVNGTVLEFF